MIIINIITTAVHVNARRANNYQTYQSPPFNSRIDKKDLKIETPRTQKYTSK